MNFTATVNIDPCTDGVLVGESHKRLFTKQYFSLKFNGKI